MSRKALMKSLVAATALLGAAPAAIGQDTATPVAKTAAAQGPIRTIDVVKTRMRDGVELVSTVWLPAAEGRYPVILMRSPYRMRTGHFADLAAFYAAHGYAVVIQDARGTGDSKGQFDFLFQETQDGYDSIESLATQPWANGKLCMMGYSYLGSVQFLAARAKPPHLTCIAPTAATGRYLEEMPSVQGAFMLQWGLNWLRTWTDDTTRAAAAVKIDWATALSHRPLLTLDEAVLGKPNRLYREFLVNDTLNAYWKRVAFTPADFAAIDIPIMLTTGWFDGDQHGELFYWRGLEARARKSADIFLTVGPWNHAQTFEGGKTRIGAMGLPESSILDDKARHLAFFDHYLKGTGPKPDWPRVSLFITGANQWRSFAEMPVNDAARRKLYLASGGHANSLEGDGSLSWARPGSQKSDGFTYDPKDPVPLDFLKSGLFGDLRDAAQSRQDVLVYSTPPLDKPVEIIGAVTMELYAASDARDTDFTAAISDVGPDGKAILLGARPVGIVRARYRHGPAAKPTLLTPGKAERYAIDLGSIGHRFLPGHRIRVDISSSAAPFFNPNQNTGNPIATDTEWRIAHQTILHDSAHPSALLLPVYEGK